VLSVKECWSLVRGASVGRLAFVVDGWPLVLPVNYLTDGDNVVLRSDPGTKLAAARRGVQATLQVDSLEPLYRSGWSVLVFGVARSLEDAADVARLDALDLRSWAASDRATWVRIRPVQITGRRLARAWRYPDPPR
jgi:nitroimidazol reductase NimA-like FMN-containing flavoprotein (pyridoxamine 5'-phosphate oxidase superfamily)